MLKLLWIKFSLQLNASMNQIQFTIKCLHLFYQTSGHKTNNLKSKILFSSNVDKNFANDIPNFSGLSLTLNLGKYLGINLVFAGSNTRKFSSLIDKIRKKLAGWQTRSLCMVRIITLAPSMLSTIPIYSTSVNKTA